MFALLQYLHREQRDEADDGSQAQRFGTAIRLVQDVVEEFVLFVPEAVFAFVAVIDGAGDVQEVLEELDPQIDVHRIFLGQLQGDAHQVQGIGGHPGGAVGLVQVIARRQRGRAVEEGDVVQAEEAALEDVAAFGVLAVDPPGEIQQQLVEDALQEDAITHSGQGFLLQVDVPGRPGMHRRIGILEIPLVGR